MEYINRSSPGTDSEEIFKKQNSALKKQNAILD